ncbi:MULTISPECIES: o-succinylbenzoate--CoA ligase [unclassified Sporosarcina]|uniref:o-succinylbenzoate--CoA ligase n=1 Tax=unclassified Sporosarcina TaxID=2647733 RepID=UPI0020403F5C|nr:MULTISPECIES: o-succinylbenzoate--CoA ligase [unclassified Sporosarcina]GKV66931.1 2-succinylbenzoate--CoA ligase [Sporosarcina sp. NCCP-2331]GLB57226.1 2-succinylbenzoate--CoA ligase [Sporosarcina sp. NCCP-2378]
MMIPNWLMQRAKLTPEQSALPGKSFHELYQASLKIAQQLHHKGVKAGDRIALLSLSNEETVLFIHASWLLSAEVVFLNNRLTEYELAWQVSDAEPGIILVDDRITEAFHFEGIECISYSAVRKKPAKEFTMLTQWDEDRTLSIMYTSGTTGLPKGVRQTVGNHTSSALASVLNLGLTDRDSWLCMMPLFHISGLSIVIRSVIYGMEMRLYEKFDAQEAAKQIMAGTVTSMSVVALTLDQIVRVMEEENNKAHPSFRTMLVGGGPVPLDYLQRAGACGLPILQTYGMTETCSQTATLGKADAMRKLGSAGKPLFFNQITIKGTDQAGEVGEVLIKGPHVTPGYIGSHSSRSPLTEDGWLATGDAGYLDEEGYLFIVDRRADLIISGGENIYPAEIENILLAHPAVREAGVCANEDERWGQVPVAFVIAKEVSEEELLAYCEQHLARYKMPKEIRFTEQLPRNASNKLMRFELKKWL